MTVLSLSIVVVSYNTRELTLACLASIAASHTQPVQIVVVDNASSDGSASAITQHFPAAHVIANTANVGFARAVNQAAACCTGEVVLLLNPDATVAADALHKLLDALAHNSQLAAVGPLILSPHGQAEHHAAAPTLSVWGQVAWRWRLPTRHSQMYLGAVCGPHGARITERLSGAALAVRRSALLAIGGLDEAYFMYFEDADLCQRLRQRGWQLACVTEARVCHAAGASSARDPSARDQRALASELLYFTKHHGRPATLALRAGIAAASLTRAVAFALPGQRRAPSAARARAELGIALRCLKG